jgi:hypothetical protein
MHGQDVVDCLEFDNECLVDEEVEPKSRVDVEVVVDHGEDDLSLDGDFPLVELVDEAGLVDALEESGAKGGVNPEGCVHNDAGELLDMLGQRLVRHRGSRQVTMGRVSSAASGIKDAVTMRIVELFAENRE